MLFEDILEDTLEEIDKDLELRTELLEAIQEEVIYAIEFSLCKLAGVDKDNKSFTKQAAKNILMILVKYGILERE